MGEPIRSILVVGGGTAGWMAAAALKTATGPHCQVRLVESEDIGIVGVGEATVPTIRDFNRMIGLDEVAFMRETKASLKLGIQFVGWGDESSSYFHPFGAYGAGRELGDFHQVWLSLRARGMASDLDAYSLCTRAAFAGRVGALDPEPRSPEALIPAAFHFDAGLYAQHLRRFCEARGVERIEGRILEVAQRADGFVDHVRLEGEKTLSADLFIDCTGFRGLLVEGALKAGYEDWSHWLPMDRAVAVPCAKAGPITPYTRATADAGGWRWRIPLQHRTGNGYVYSSRFIDQETATARLLETLDGELLAEPRHLRFVTGRRKAYWDRNVVALGLSSGFIEPLESTSIHLVHVGLNRLLQHFPDSGFSPGNIAAYNRRVGRDVEQVRDFVILHYHLTQRRDADLWRYVADMPIPDALAERVELFRERGILSPQSADDYFSPTSWLAVMIGQGLHPRAHNPLYDLNNPATQAGRLKQVETAFAEAAARLPLHEDYLRSGGMVAADA